MSARSTLRAFAVSLLFACACLAALPARAIDLPAPPPVAAKAWLLMDTQSGQVLQSLAPDERVEPASLTKLMTAYVVFGALREQRINLTQSAPVSERAWKAEGSRMFIEPRKPVSVEELIQGMIIQSGNDACIALAELVAGSEDLFAQLMNREAQRLGLKNTHFVNATGLPDPQHYSTARDLATLAAALVRDFPEQYKYYSQKEFRYNNIRQQNRNRLLWLDPTVDGMKTGFTDNAGYCLIASAKRGERRLVSVVLGTASDSMRAQESQKLLNFGFQFYDNVKLYAKGQPVSTLKVWKGSSSELRAGSLATDMVISVPHGSAGKIQAQFVGQEPLIAPVSAGQRVGIVKVTLEGKPVAEYPVVALENVGVAGFFGRMWDGMRLWFK
ncbi:MAG TPA: D-alanyl-D-alanine carboxypeptidase family protein [Burkholderiales bacterium]|nr:D-alanyl-D-alanine carboxypeptidase family protein [Burkholderiales bacterium]